MKSISHSNTLFNRKSKYRLFGFVWAGGLVGSKFINNQMMIRWTIPLPRASSKTSVTFWKKSTRADFCSIWLLNLVIRRTLLSTDSIWFSCNEKNGIKLNYLFEINYWIICSWNPFEFLSLKSPSFLFIFSPILPGRQELCEQSPKSLHSF